MKYETHNDREIDVNFSSLQGCVEVDYKTLKKLFGPPGLGDAYKVSAKWDIQFEDGVVATIYDYKTGKTYCGRKEGISKTKNTDWHVGGFDRRAFDRIQALLSTQL